MAKPAVEVEAEEGAGVGDSGSKEGAGEDRSTDEAESDPLSVGGVRGW